MADIPPNNPLPGAPTGAEPLKKSTGKVQPKKETVRINLPPKPTAAPTIKLPTLPPGGPTGAPSMVAPAIAKAPAAPAPAAAAPLAKAAAPVAATGAPRPAPPRPSAPVIPTLKMMDKVLIISAMVMSLAAVGTVGWVFWTLKGTVETFNS
ncbi:MAG TPA: hypothetical protein VK815_02600 [Candidatus Acidoferrales bacterium]|jgi:hypothetical protein|nr:hypothetical protein [Candidatus Acidoferrales bacterium]